MKSKQIEKEILKIKSKVLDYISYHGVSETAKDSGLKHPDVSAWFNYRRVWSFEKILKIADKLGL